MAQEAQQLRHVRRLQGGGRLADHIRQAASDNVHVCCHGSAHDAVFAVGALQPADYVLGAVWAVVVYHDDLKVLLAADRRQFQVSVCVTFVHAAPNSANHRT